jgi:hypothetical protein
MDDKYERSFQLSEVYVRSADGKIMGMREKRTDFTSGGEVL